MPHFTLMSMCYMCCLLYAGYFPSREGLIAPGMHCSYVVKFTPDSLANYEEQFMVCTYAVHVYPSVWLPNVLVQCHAIGFVLSIVCRLLP